MKNALITGASRGLGLALATELAKDGWNLTLTARGADDLAEVAHRLGAAAIPGDVADAAHRQRLAEAVQDLDLLVNNASGLGAVPLPALADYPVPVLRELLETNVLAPLALTQAVLPALRRSGGAVLNVSSDAAVEAYEGWGGYGATKAALEQISHVLAAEEKDLAVWWLDPGEMRTRMLADAIGPQEAGEAPLPEEVAPLVVKLITERRASGRYTRGSLA
ncbi:SDR family NAD(P)-dependent oxidoreductase [Herbidospora sp. RD11066]